MKEIALLHHDKYVKKNLISHVLILIIINTWIMGNFMTKYMKYKYFLHCCLHSIMNVNFKFNVLAHYKLTANKEHYTLYQYKKI